MPSEVGVTRSRDPSDIWRPNHISGTADAKVVKFGVQVGYIKC